MQRGLSGSVLKWIAIITMLIDHLGASLIEVYLMNVHGTASYQGYGSMSYEQMMIWYNLDRVLRCIGRISFPIFCFLLVEGFCHTKNVKKYALRLGVFCLLSEIPFDLAFLGQVIHWEYQNVFFTLFLALLGIWGMDNLRKKGHPMADVAGLVTIGAAALAAELLCTDYGAFGVVMIGILYRFRKRVYLKSILGAGALLLYGGIEGYGALAFFPILLYDGTRGKQPKYFFYAFYPVHLLVLTAIGRWLLPVIL